MGKLRENSHIFYIIVISLLALALAFYLGADMKRQEAKERQGITNDTANINAAHRTYEKVHRQQLMDDPDYAELYEINEELNSRILKIKEYAEEAQEHLDDLEDQGNDVSDTQVLLDDIVSECQTLYPD